MYIKMTKGFLVSERIEFENVLSTKVIFNEIYLKFIFFKITP